MARPTYSDRNSKNILSVLNLLDSTPLLVDADTLLAVAIGQLAKQSSSESEHTWPKPYLVMRDDQGGDSPGWNLLTEGDVVQAIAQGIDPYQTSLANLRNAAIGQVIS